MVKHTDSVKTIREMLIQMRCPEFFDGVADGFEKKFDDQLKAIIAITNEIIRSNDEFTNNFTEWLCACIDGLHPLPGETHDEHIKRVSARVADAF